MKREPTKAELGEQLQLLRAQQQQLKKQVFELGCHTAKLYREIDRIAEAPARAAALK